MSIRELIEKINTSKPSEVWFNLEDLAEELQVQVTPDEFLGERMKGYFIHVWHCTDTWVGSVAWFLDNEFVYYTFQSARKDSKSYIFASQEAFEKVVNFVMSFVKLGLTPDFMDLEEEIPEKFSVNYSSQILHKQAWWGGKKVEIVKSHFPYTKDSRDYFERVDIKLEGKLKTVKVSELLFDWGNPLKQ